MLIRASRTILKRLNGRRALPHLQKESVEDFSTEEEFQDAVDIATLRKGRPDLYHFEDVVPDNSRIYANDKFKFLDQPELWKSHNEYYQAAIEASFSILLLLFYFNFFLLFYFQYNFFFFLLLLISKFCVGAEQSAGKVSPGRLGFGS